MPALPTLNGRDVVKAFTQDGWQWRDNGAAT